MLTRLQGKEFPNHNTVPVMIVSIMARMQARILHLHYSHAGLIISKTGFLSFSTAESATLNMDIVLGIMASKVIGDTKDPSNLLKPISPTATPAESVLEPCERSQKVTQSFTGL
ncbi:hypothetical protein N7519_001353 [Penicillium mononematosum]|uniref:uncharacterized protein n=1 Tax=Penicillium mononematosum TaxID=268346 RepID=UPI0025469DB5|nr:uncharacterized protein N7519_001353 [Penicillium mononematosum]KAJ6191332.1 hypothetical protein N7519_001353 [Penicillium mononematosum]